MRQTSGLSLTAIKVGSHDRSVLAARLVFTTCLIMTTLNATGRAADSSDKVGIETYRVQPGDSLSELLYARGVGHGLDYRLYGPGGYIEINKQLNPHIRDWRTLKPGDILNINAPKQLTPQPQEARPQEAHPQEVQPQEAHPQEAQPQEAQPQEAQPQEPAAANEAEPLPLRPSPDSSSNEPTELSPSLVDSVKSADDRPHLLAVGRAMSLVENAIVLPLLRLNRVKFIAGHGPWRGLSIIGDYVAKVHDDFDDETFDLGWSKVGFGWRFALDLPLIFDRVTVTPSAALWQFSGHMPTESSSGELSRRSFVIRKRPSVAYEVGLERRFTVVPVDTQVTYGREVTVAPFGLAPNDASLSTERIELNASFGRWIVAAPAYRLSVQTFFLQESTTLRGGTSQVVDGLSPENAGQGAGQPERNEVFFGLNHLGLGLVLTW